MRSLLGIAAVTLLLASCSAPPAREASSFEVVASIPPLAYMVEKIGGTEVPVEVLLQPGQEPHTFEAKPQHVEKILRAKLLVAVGLLPFERQLLDRIGAMDRKPKVLECAAGLALRPFVEYEFDCAGHDEEEHAHEEKGTGELPMDPHVWLGPACLEQMAKTIAAALTAMVPEKAALFERNLAALLEALRARDAASLERLKPWRGRSVVVFHPAFGYFLDQYGLRQRAVEVGGKQPTPKQLKELVETARKEGVTTVFCQPQLDPRTAGLVAEQIGGKVVALDPMPVDVLANFAAMTEAVGASFGAAP